MKIKNRIIDFICIHWRILLYVLFFIELVICVFAYIVAMDGYKVWLNGGFE